MNNEYLKLAWQDAVNKGYKNSVDDFYTLLSSNDEWLTRSWNDAKEQGYKGDLDSYSRLLGLKKKAETAPEPSPLEQPSPAQNLDSTSVQAPAGTSSVSPVPFVEAKYRRLYGLNCTLMQLVKGECDQFTSGDATPAASTVSWGDAPVIPASVTDTIPVATDTIPGGWSDAKPTIEK